MTQEQISVQIPDWESINQLDHRLHRQGHYPLGQTGRQISFKCQQITESRATAVVNPPAKRGDYGNSPEIYKSNQSDPQ